MAKLWVMNINDRLREIRKSLQISQREFSKRIFISQSLYADIEKGNIEPKERFLRLISSEYNINLDWMKTGNGEMWNLSPIDLRLEYLIEIFRQFNPELQDVILDHLRRLLEVHKKD